MAEQGQESFRGIFHHAMDKKGRVSLPASFRSQIGDEPIVLTNFVSDGARCLEGYGLSRWEIFEEKLRKRSRFDPKIRKLENYYLARAASCELDSSGRITVAPHLRNYAALERDVVFTSTLNGFRIWDERVWDVIFSEAEQALLGDPELFVELDAE